MIHIKFSVEEMDIISKEIKEKYIMNQVNKIIKEIEDDIEINLKQNEKYKYGCVYINYKLQYLDEILKKVEDDVVKNGFKFTYRPYQKSKGFINNILGKYDDACIWVTYGKCNEFDLEKIYKKRNLVI